MSAQLRAGGQPPLAKPAHSHWQSQTGGCPGCWAGADLATRASARSLKWTEKRAPLLSPGPCCPGDMQRGPPHCPTWRPELTLGGGLGANLGFAYLKAAPLWPCTAGPCEQGVVESFGVGCPSLQSLLCPSLFPRPVPAPHSPHVQAPPWGILVTGSGFSGLGFPPGLTGVRG